MKRSVSKLLALVLAFGSSSSLAAEIKTASPTCQNAYAVLGWSKFDVQEAEALAKLADARLRKAKVHEAMGDPCGAYGTYQGVIALAERNVDPSKVSEARSRMATLEPSLRSRVTVKAELATSTEKTTTAPDKDVTITVDGARVTGPTFSVAPGSHVLAIAVKGYKTHTETLVVCNQTPMVEVILQRDEVLAAPAGPAPSATKPAAADAEDDEDDDDGSEKSGASASSAGGAGASGAAPAAASEAALPPSGPVLRGTSAQRRELSKWAIAANDYQRIADHWALSKRLPWIKIGWVLGSKRHLKQVESVQPGVPGEVTFRQYKVKGQDGAYAYVAQCGTGGTCNAVAQAFYFRYRGVGLPQVECATLPNGLESPMTPEIPIPTPEEVAQRDAEYAAANAVDTDDEDDKDDKDDKDDDAKSGAKGAEKDDDDDDDD